MNKEVNKLQLIIDKLLDSKKDIKILEAGCGSYNHINIKKKTYIVGIDISRNQLKKNKNLNEKILGDIQSFDFPVSEFDMVICWNVLEHLIYPINALENFIKTLKDNGIIVLAAPNLLSIKGILTKYTPHWFHVWVYKNLFKYEHAGKEDHVPFKTFFRFSITPHSIKKFAVNNDLSIEYYNIYESQKQKNIRRNKPINITLSTLFFIIIILSFNKINSSFTDFIIVLKKQKKVLYS